MITKVYRLEKAYGAYLKAKKIIPYNSRYFKRLAKGMTQVSPYPLERFLSLYFNISEVFKLLEDYIRELDSNLSTTGGKPLIGAG